MPTVAPVASLFLRMFVLVAVVGVEHQWLDWWVLVRVVMVEQYREEKQQYHYYYCPSFLMLLSLAFEFRSFYHCWQLRAFWSLFLLVAVAIVLLLVVVVVALVAAFVLVAVQIVASVLERVLAFLAAAAFVVVLVVVIVTQVEKQWVMVLDVPYGDGGDHWLDVVTPAVACVALDCASQWWTFSYFLINYWLKKRPVNCWFISLTFL